MRSTPHRTRDDRGAAAVEFALVLPLLMLIVVGIIQFGRIYSMQIELEGAANAGARYLAVHPTDTAETRNRTRAAANNLALTDAEIAVTAAVPCTATSQVSVTASRVFVFDIPLLPHPNITLHGKGVMPCTG
jgi:Flp pilus assembly protein TadG